MNEYTEILENSVNRLFGDISGKPESAENWELVEELGILNLFLPEELGGMDGGWQEASIVFRLCGYHALPLPVGETMIARRLLHESGKEIPSGPLNLNDVVTGETLMKYGAYMRTSQISGAILACLEKTVDYTRDRKQFGRQLSKFQAIQHQLALLAEEAAAVASASAAAALALDRSDGGFEVSCAKLRANEAAGVVAGISHQLHGAIGITKEFGLYRHTQRLWAWRAEFGNNRYWAQRIGKYVLGNSDNSAWDLITSRGNR
ncbi:acyl-CoA dehydrogenase family protein [Emcibacter sp.]|uniref:acyl-CoA dehydrogenase family protein n=1 Tax=Emcibacter sp. TaxID=1979954 RepID=UPI002AA729BD|nr:acyl-CoA dehydrogenase family protein [Emcibacter sp.]